MFRNKTGIQLALMTAVISGVSVFVNKFAVGLIKPPVLFTGLKNVMVGLILLSLLLATRKIGTLKNLTKKQWGQLLAVGVVGGYIPFYLFFSGLASTDAVAGAIIHKSLVFWVALLAWPLLKEKMTFLKLAAVMILFYANAMVGGFKGFSYGAGELMILTATLFWAVENVIAKKALTSMDPEILTFGRMGIGSLLLLATAYIQAPTGLMTLTSLSLTSWAVLVATALTLFAFVSTWYRALQKEEAITVTALLVPATLITNLLNALLVTHTWNMQGTYQLALMVLGTGLWIYASRKKDLSFAKN